MPQKSEKERKKYNMLRQRKHRKSNKEKNLQYRREYYENNKDHILLLKKIWRINNKEKEREYKVWYRINHPWSVTLENVKARVSGRNTRHDYTSIKNTLTLKQLEYLWKRDKADHMLKSALHRKNNNGDYTVRNCEYVESGWHSSYHNKQRKKDIK